MKPEIWEEYNNKADEYISEGELEEALEILQKIIKEEESKKEISLLDFTEILHKTALLSLQLEQIENALEYQTKVIEIKEKKLTTTHSDLASAFEFAAQICRKLNNKEKEIEYKYKVLKIREQEAFSKKNPQSEMQIDDINKTYNYLQDYVKAKDYLDKAVALLQEILPEGHPDLENAKKVREEMQKAHKTW